MVKRVLLVEDNPDDEALTLRALKKTGFDLNLAVVRDGQEAVDYLLKPTADLTDERCPRPDLVLLDLKLPRLGGLQVLERLRADAQLRTIPVVGLTSSKEEEDVMNSYDLGANSYVRKRVDALEFEDTLRDILTYWFEFIKLPPRIF